MTDQIKAWATTIIHYILLPFVVLIIIIGYLLADRKEMQEKLKERGIEGDIKNDIDKEKDADLAARSAIDKWDELKRSRGDS